MKMGQTLRETTYPPPPPPSSCLFKISQLFESCENEKRRGNLQKSQQRWRFECNEVYSRGEKLGTELKLVVIMLRIATILGKPL